MPPGDDDGRSQRLTVQAGYDELAETYADERQTLADDAVVDRLLAAAPDGRVLDAGCGAGRPFLEHLAAHRPVLGLDFSAEQVRRAADVAPGRVLQGDMTALPVADDGVAAVTPFYSLIHVPADRHADVYAEFARALRPGGVVLVTTGTEDWSGRNDDWLDTGVAMEWDILGEERSTALLEDAGFEVSDRVGVVDDLGDGGDRGGDTLVDPDSEAADKLFLLATLEP